MTVGKSAVDRVLSHDEVRQIVAQAAASLNLKGKRVLTLIPDGTRTMPMPLMFQLLQEEIGAASRRLRLSRRAGHASADERGPTHPPDGMSRSQRNLRQSPRVQPPLGPSRHIRGSGHHPGDRSCRGLRRPLVGTDPGQDQSPALRLRPGPDLWSRCFPTKWWDFQAATNICSRESARER